MRKHKCVWLIDYKLSIVRSDNGVSAYASAGVCKAKVSGGESGQAPSIL